MFRFKRFLLIILIIVLVAIILFFNRPTNKDKKIIVVEPTVTESLEKSKTEPIQTEPVQENNVVIPSEPEVTEQVSEQTSTQEVKPTESAEVIPAGLPLVVKDELWESAFYPHDKSTGNIASGVGFNFLGKEVTVYSPTDGYVQIFFNKSGGEAFLSITANAPRVPASTIEELNDPDRNKSIMFIGYGIESLVVNDSFVKKGKEIAVVNSEKVILTDKLKEEVSLILVPETDWDKDIQRDEDPREYLKQLLEIMEK